MGTWEDGADRWQVWAKVVAVGQTLGLGWARTTDIASAFRVEIGTARVSPQCGVLRSTRGDPQTRNDLLGGGPLAAPAPPLGECSGSPAAPVLPRAWLAQLRRNTARQREARLPISTGHPGFWAEKAPCAPGRLPLEPMGHPEGPPSSPRRVRRRSRCAGSLPRCADPR